MATPKKTKKTDPFLRTTILNSSSQDWDFYHRAIRISWPLFLGLFVLFFMAINACFACAYLLEPNTISGARPGSFWDHFFFSVQTLATIGYGAMSPQTVYAHILVTIEAMMGLLGVGMFAAISFARLSLPNARIKFSNVAVITDFNGVPTLMFRLANERRSSLIGAKAQVSLLRQENSVEGHKMRRFQDLTLLRSETPMLAFSWMVMHPITETSPLRFLFDEHAEALDYVILINIVGMEETTSQTVHARYSYFENEVLLGHRYVDMIQEGSAGERLVDLQLIDRTVVDAKN